MYVKYFSKPSVGSDIPWEPVSKKVTPDDFKFMEITNPKQMEVKVDNNFGDFEFWESLGFKENL